MSDYYHLTDSESMPLFDSMVEDATTTTFGVGPESEQKKQLRRVTGKLSGAIVEFFDGLEVGEEFHGPQLTKFVESKIAASVPDSATRVMRNLRLCGQINYENVNRTQSLYRKLEVRA